MALIPSFLIQPELEAGSLVIPFDRPLSSEQAYYLVYPTGLGGHPGLARFRAWMLASAGADQAPALG